MQGPEPDCLDLKEASTPGDGSGPQGELGMADRPTLTLENDPETVEAFVASLQASATPCRWR